MRVYVTNADSNGIRMLNVTRSGELNNAGFIDLSPYGGGPNSVAVHGDLVAVAVEAKNKQANGSIVLFDLTGKPAQIQGLKGNIIEAGALPDMVTFSPNGQYIIVANEGEPSKDYKVDPEGSVSIIDTSNWTVRNATFTKYNGVNLKDVIENSLKLDLKCSYKKNDDSPVLFKIPDLTKLRELGWAPNYSLDYGIEKTYHSLINA